MKHAIISIVMVVLIVLPFSAIAVSQQQPEPVAQAQGIVNCSDVKVGQQVKITCTAAGVVVLSTTVDIPVLELPGATIRVPGPTRTVATPGPTVFLPGPTKTVTRPGETVTRTAEPGTPPRGPVVERTVTAQPEPAPTKTVTATPGQDGTTPATIEPAPEQPQDEGSLTIPELNLSAPQAAGIGFLAVLAIMGLILLGMYSGYYLGYRDSDQEEAKFINSLLGKNNK